MADAGSTEDDASAPGRMRRVSGWLFERRPARGVDGVEHVAEPLAEPEPPPTPRPAPISLALDAAEAAQAGQTEEPPEPTGAAEANESAEAEATGAGATESPESTDADRDGDAEAEPADPEDPEDPELKARPRPWAGAPVVYEKPAVTMAKTPAKADPIAEFFARKDDDEGRRWFGRSKDDKPAEKRDHKPWPNAVRRTTRFVIVIAIAVGAALLLRTFVVQPYYVPSESMEPTLHGCQGCNDDHVLVEKLSYRFHDVKAGDIVVFHRPATWPASQVPDGVLIKRVIGVAGDRLTLKHGRVFRNGQVIEEPYVNQQCKRGTTDKTGSTRKKTYPKIPNGEVFVMGDNRCDSEDSRFFGDVPTSDVIGRAFLIIWPFSRIHSLK